MSFKAGDRVACDRPDQFTRVWHVADAWTNILGVNMVRLIHLGRDPISVPASECEPYTPPPVVVTGVIPFFNCAYHLSGVGHSETMRALHGKRLRVTIEVLD